MTMPYEVTMHEQTLFDLIFMWMDLYSLFSHFFIILHLIVAFICCLHYASIINVMYIYTSLHMSYNFSY